VRFWTVLQHPFHEAVLVHDGEILRRIPDHPAKTLSRRVGAVGTFDGHLVLVRHSSIEFWDKEGRGMVWGYHHRMIYAPHRAVQLRDLLLICSSGLDLFLAVEPKTGATKWEWWGWLCGMGGRSERYGRMDWEAYQTTSDGDAVEPSEGAHFNSITLQDGGATFLTAALRRRRIIEIDAMGEGFRHVAWVDEPSIHSPLFHKGVLIYGTEAGVRVGTERVLEELRWVKFVERLPDDGGPGGFILTHDAGVAIVDEDWNIVDKVYLPKPFQVALFER